MAIQHTPTLQLPYPESTDTANVPRDIKALADAMDPLGVAPVGAMFMWPAASAPADVDGTGRALWLLMLGQAVPAATYPKLATLLGSAGGNITIPDMRDRFPVGAGPTMPLASAGGASSIVLATAHMPVHNHGGNTVSSSAPNHLHTAPQYAFAITDGAVGGAAGNTMFGTVTHTTLTDVADRSLAHTHPINVEGSGQGHENRPPYRAVNFIIRAG